MTGGRTRQKKKKKKNAFSTCTDKLNQWKSMIVGIIIYIQRNLNNENEKTDDCFDASLKTRGRT